MKRQLSSDKVASFAKQAAKAPALNMPAMSATSEATAKLAQVEPSDCHQSAAAMPSAKETPAVVTVQDTAATEALEPRGWKAPMPGIRSYGYEMDLTEAEATMIESLRLAQKREESWPAWWEGVAWEMIHNLTAMALHGQTMEEISGLYDGENNAMFVNVSLAAAAAIRAEVASNMKYMGQTSRASATEVTEPAPTGSKETAAAAKETAAKRPDVMIGAAFGMKPHLVNAAIGLVFGDLSPEQQDHAQEALCMARAFCIELSAKGRSRAWELVTNGNVDVWDKRITALEIADMLDYEEKVREDDPTYTVERDVAISRHLSGADLLQYMQAARFLRALDSIEPGKKKTA